MTISKPTRRWLAHLGLITTAITSLTFEFVLTLHILLGLVFVALVVVHLGHERRTSSRLIKRLTKVRLLNQPQGRLAIADLSLALFSGGMFASGLWDWALGHPTRIRYHALLGVGLAIFLLVHSVSADWRRERLVRSSASKTALTLRPSPRWPESIRQ
jgi:hypothetical protein